MPRLWVVVSADIQVDTTVLRVLTLYFQWGGLTSPVKMSSVIAWPTGFDPPATAGVLHGAVADWACCLLRLRPNGHSETVAHNQE
jgi:hypothetical protein